MNLRKLLIPLLLATLATVGCAGLGIGSSDDSGTAGLGGGSRSGPKVSDSEISSNIQSALKQDPELAAANITVRVESGRVTLSGNTPNVQAYLRAGSLARNVPGVRPPVNVSNLQYPR